MRLTIPKLRTWHLLGIVAASAAFFAVMEVRWRVEDPGYDLIRQLRSSDALVRVKAARELVWHRPRERRAIAPLCEMLFDPDATARASAARVLPEVIDRTDEAEVEQVKAALGSALGDRNPIVRLAIARSLCGLNPEPKVVVPTLLELARGEDAPIRARAISMLGPFGRRSEPALAALFASLGDADFEVRIRSVDSLGYCSWIPNVPPGPLLGRIKAALVAAADDEDARVRAEAIQALGSIAARSRTDDPRVLRALDDPISTVRAAAAASLGWNWPGRRSKVLVPALVRALADADWQVRYRSARSLGFLGDEAEAAIPALRASAGDPAEAARDAAIEAAQKIQEAVRIVRAVMLPGAIAELGDADPIVRALAAGRIEAIGPRAAEAIPALVRCLDDGEADVRRAAADALSRLGPKAEVAGPSLARLAESDPDERVRRSARLSRSNLLLDAGGEGPTP